MRVRQNIWLGPLGMLLTSVTCAQSSPTTNSVAPVSVRETASFNEAGLASFYADEYNGQPTASGETFPSQARERRHALPEGSAGS